MMRALLVPLPANLALAGVTAAGVGWSLAVGWARWDEVQGSGLDIPQALPPLIAGGMATVLSLWFAVGAVMWAMCRALGQRMAFRSVLLVLSASGLLLILAAPAAAFQLAGAAMVPAELWLLCIAGVTAYCFQVADNFSRSTMMPMAKAWGCLVLTGVFCASFVSLYQ
jgi:hypothetical protein